MKTHEISKNITKRSPKNFYGVAVRLETGIFESWAHVKDATNGYSGKKQQGFETIEGAITFMMISGFKQQELLVTDKHGKKHLLENYINKRGCHQRKRQIQQQRKNQCLHQVLVPVLITPRMTKLLLWIQNQQDCHGRQRQIQLQVNYHH